MDQIGLLTLVKPSILKVLEITNAPHGQILALAPYNVLIYLTYNNLLHTNSLSLHYEPTKRPPINITIDNFKILTGPLSERSAHPL